MSRTDDISNLFSRFGATSDSYYEFESQFDYKSTPPSLEKTAVPVEQVPLAAAIAPVVALVAPVPQSVPLVVVSPVAQATAQPAVPSVVLAIEPPNLPIQAPLMTPAGAGKPLRNLLAEVVLARQTGAQSLHNEALPRPPKCKAHIVALVSAKGGVGKTTLSAGLASSLRLSGGKTLAIDLDPQNALQYHLGVESGVPGMCNTNQAATAWASLLQQGFEGVQLLPYGVPSNDERSALEREMSQDRHWLARQLDHLALGENDLVILDTPTGRTAYLQQALDVADQVLVVTTADAASFITMDQMDRLLGALGARPAFSVCNYVVNQFDAGREFSRDMLEVLKRRLGRQLLGVIARDNTLGEALAYGQNPLATPSASAACQDMLLLSEQLKTRFQTPSAVESSAS